MSIGSKNSMVDSTHYYDNRQAPYRKEQRPYNHSFQPEPRTYNKKPRGTNQFEYYEKGSDNFHHQHEGNSYKGHRVYVI